MSCQEEVIFSTRREDGMNVLLLTDKQFNDIVIALKWLNAKRDRDNKYYAKNNNPVRENNRTPRFTISNYVPPINL